MLEKGVAPEAGPAPKLDQEMTYRRDAGEVGVRADDANLDKLISAGMTDTPKVRWSNSILDDVKAKEESDDKKKNASVKPDVNAGAPAADEEVSPAKAKKALERMAKDAPNPNAQPEDPATDPAAAAKAENAMEAASAAKTVAADATAAKAKKAALAQIRDVDPEVAAAIAATKIESVKGPPGAPIGYGVHALSIEGGNPYAAKQMYRAAEPA
jgi:hypothetical protein